MILALAISLSLVMDTNVSAVRQEWAPAIAEALRPRRAMRIWEWADAYRHLPVRGAAEPGPYRSIRTPYVRGIMDAIQDPSVNVVAVQKSAQTGLTEAANTILAYWADMDPGPAMIVYPAQDDCREEMRDRLKPMFESSPRLAALIPHEGWATQDELTLTSMNVVFAWAASPRTLIRRATRYCLCDEIDNCQNQSGRLGDTLALIHKRMTTYGWRRKLFLPSTPTTDHGAIHRLGQEFGLTRYFVPCPACGAWQSLAFARLRVPPDERDAQRIRALDLARYFCAACEAPLRDAEHKRWMAERGVWVPPGRTILETLNVGDAEAVARAHLDHPQWTPPATAALRAPGGNEAVAGRCPKPDTVVFHVWAALSPWIGWSDLLADFFAARGDPERIRVFTNSVLGEAFLETAAETDLATVRRRRLHSHPRDVVPVWGLAMTAGADVQADCIYYVVRAWGARRRSWLIREGVALSLEELYEAVARPVERAGGGGDLTPHYLAVDSGFHTLDVYEFARTHAGVMAVKGTDSGIPVRPARIEFTPRGRSRADSVALHHVNVSDFKERILHGLRCDPQDAGAFFLHATASDEYCAHLCAEHKVLVRPKHKKGRARFAWQKKSEGAPNHYLDCEVYAMAAAEHNGLLRLKETEASCAPPPPPPAPRPDRPYGRRPLGLNLKTFGSA